MVEDAVEPRSDAVAAPEATRAHGVVERARDLMAGALYTAASLITPVVILEARDVNDPLPADAGVYLFRDHNCLGPCAWVRGRSSKLGTYFPWSPRSAYSVGAGALWRSELTTTKTAPHR